MDIDKLLLYSQCPMRYYFSEYLGIDDYTSTFKGQIDKAIVTGLYSYFYRYDDENIVYILGKGLSGIDIPSDSRGSDRLREKYRNEIENAKNKILYAVENIRDMRPNSIVASPYRYTIFNGSISGYIDLIFTIGDTYYVVVYDMSRSYPSDEYLDNGIRCTLACEAFMGLFPKCNFKLVHYNIWNTAFIVVSRDDSQMRSVKYELESVLNSANNTISNNMWYRSKSYLCNNCYANEPCTGIYRRLGRS